MNSHGIPNPTVETIGAQAPTKKTAGSYRQSFSTVKKIRRARFQSPKLRAQADTGPERDI
jgi:hypothetical protein